MNNAVRQVYIIAEAGVNHNGSLDIALQLIDAAKAAGVDAVKFQTFKADKLVSKSAPKADYQLATTEATESQYEMLKKLELSEEDHIVLDKYCRETGVQFLSTPFDLDSLDWLCDHLQLDTVKISSGDLTNATLLLAAARKRVMMILSTGMSSLGEIESAMGVLAFGYLHPNEEPQSESDFINAYRSEQGQQELKKHVRILHCTTEYPAPLSEVNLKAMATLHAAFQLPIGYSDHTEGIVIPIAAVAQGATVIEKHFTLDRNMPGPDHKASLEPEELKQMVQGIRQVEQALGIGLKVPSDSEMKNAAVARKSLVAAKDIEIGETFTSTNLTVKRPGTGVEPIKYWDLLGTTATRSYKKDDVI
ncbi:N-acetylneuraminate synthase [Cohnella sp. GCM10027633]|uniref:N-acetylneuraminate synthase n=1 Tax=unclassified Cohnella TaxID=2636738 RepID=UPI00362D797C